jgi:transposase-like protein
MENCEEHKFISRDLKATIIKDIIAKRTTVKESSISHGIDKFRIYQWIGRHKKGGGVPKKLGKKRIVTSPMKKQLIAFFQHSKSIPTDVVEKKILELLAENCSDDKRQFKIGRMTVWRAKSEIVALLFPRHTSDASVGSVSRSHGLENTVASPTHSFRGSNILSPTIPTKYIDAVTVISPRVDEEEEFVLHGIFDSPKSQDSALHSQDSLKCQESQHCLRHTSKFNGLLDESTTVLPQGLDLLALAATRPSGGGNSVGISRQVSYLRYLS